METQYNFQINPQRKDMDFKLIQNICFSTTQTEQDRKAVPGALLQFSEYNFIQISFKSNREVYNFP